MKQADGKILSGWQDSNLRPPAPKAGAITGLRYTPKIQAVRGGFEPPVRLPVRQFSKLLVSATHPPHHETKELGIIFCFSQQGCKFNQSLLACKIIIKKRRGITTPFCFFTFILLFSYDFKLKFHLNIFM